MKTVETVWRTFGGDISSKGSSVPAGDRRWHAMGRPFFWSCGMQRNFATAGQRCSRPRKARHWRLPWPLVLFITVTLLRYECMNSNTVIRCILYWNSWEHGPLVRPRQFIHSAVVTCKKRDKTELSWRVPFHSWLEQNLQRCGCMLSYGTLARWLVTLVVISL